MGVLDIIKAGAKEALKPETHIIGDKFEDFILSRFNATDTWDLIKRTQDYSHNEQMFEKSSLEPDFRFKHKLSDIQINIECKYKSSSYNGMLEWCKTGQLNKYKRMDKFNNTYILIGLGGNPNSPERLFLIKLSDIRYEKLYLSFLKNYEINPACCFDYKFGKIIQLEENLSKTLLLKKKFSSINKTINKLIK